MHLPTNLPEAPTAFCKKKKKNQLHALNDFTHAFVFVCVCERDRCV